MAVRMQPGTPSYKLAWTEAAGRMRRLSQPGMGWSFGMAEREAKLVFDRLWLVPDVTMAECIHGACEHVFGEAQKVLAANKSRGKDAGALPAG